MTRTRNVAEPNASNWLFGLQPTPDQPAGFDPFFWSLTDRIEPGSTTGIRAAPSGGPIARGSGALDLDLRSRMQQLTQSEGTALRAGPIRIMGKKFGPGDGDRLWLHLRAHGRSYKKWAKHHPVEARRIGRPRDVYKMTRSIRRHFEQVGSPLAKFAPNFVVAGYLSGYDPRFIAAFAALESGWGRYTPSNAPYNFWGWSVYTGQQHSLVTRPFKKPGTAFRFFGRSLRKNYGGAKSVFSSIWAPYAADPNHERNIASILRNNFGGNPNNIRFPRRLLDR